MAVYEIINPSDYYTMKTDNWQAACAACMFLGQGMYGLQELSNDPSHKSNDMPVLMGGASEWFKKTFGVSLDDWFKNNLGLVADALESVVIGDREVYEATFPLVESSKIDQFKAEWLDKNRSSMNNIGSRATQIARALRKKIGAEVM
jgi:hypothetical protein